jgi:Zn-dependent metalloprotease
MHHELIPVRCIVPPHILRELARSSHGQVRDWAERSIMRSERVRGARERVRGLALGIPAGKKRRTVYDGRGGTQPPFTLVREEGQGPVDDQSVNEAYDGAGDTYDFYLEVLQRNSIDGRGMRLDSVVHYDDHMDNAFWNGSEMSYGDGDGEYFDRFTKCLDVIGHELTHGVTEHTAGLEYSGQAGALNESVSDVFGSLVKQYRARQTATEADWLIGKGLFTSRVQGEALRSMKAPGTAYDDPHIGKDPQPAHMKDYQDVGWDNGGVHINSGIPNRAFYLVAVGLGGQAWTTAGRIWYTALQRLVPTSNLQDAANMTVAVAGELTASGEQRVVRDAWRQVGITPR